MHGKEKAGRFVLVALFTLNELLIAIVLMGVLTAVAMVGIGGLADNGAASACRATMGAAADGQCHVLCQRSADATPSQEYFHDLVSPTAVLDIPSGGDAEPSLRRATVALG